jgi:hypothetical protein
MTVEQNVAALSFESQSQLPACHRRIDGHLVGHEVNSRRVVGCANDGGCQAWLVERLLVALEAPPELVVCSQLNVSTPTAKIAARLAGGSIGLDPVSRLGSCISLGQKSADGESPMKRLRDNQQQASR